MVEGRTSARTQLFADLHDRYVFSLKEKVLDPFLKNANFRRALKDYDTEAFRTYDKRIRADVTFLITNLSDSSGTRSRVPARSASTSWTTTWRRNSGSDPPCPTGCASDRLVVACAFRICYFRVQAMEQTTGQTTAPGGPRGPDDDSGA